MPHRRLMARKPLGRRCARWTRSARLRLSCLRCFHSAEPLGMMPCLRRSEGVHLASMNSYYSLGAINVSHKTCYSGIRASPVCSTQGTNSNARPPPTGKDDADGLDRQPTAKRFAVKTRNSTENLGARANPDDQPHDRVRRHASNKTAPAHNPPPNPTSTTLSPGATRPASQASQSAMSALEALVFPTSAMET